MPEPKKAPETVLDERDRRDYERVVSSFYGEETVTAIITLKVDTKEADSVATNVAKQECVEDVFLVTGDTDIVAKVKLQNYAALKRFIVDTIAAIDGVKDTKTLMVVTTFKERGEKRLEPGSESTG